MDIFDYYRQAQLQAEINQTRDETLRSQEATFELTAHVRQLEKTTRALWSLVKAKTGWTDEELIEHAKALEAGSGNCPSCGRRLLVQHSPKCSWCGHTLEGSLPVS